MSANSPAIPTAKIKVERHGLVLKPPHSEQKYSCPKSSTATIWELEYSRPHAKFTNGREMYSPGTDSVSNSSKRVTNEN